MNPSNPNSIKPLNLQGLMNITFVDLVGMIYKVFPWRKNEIFLEKQRPWRRSEKNRLDVPWDLLPCAPAPCRNAWASSPPLVMMYRSSKSSPWSAKGSFSSRNLSQIRVATFVTKKLVLMTLYTCLYIGIWAPGANPNRAGLLEDSQ